MFCKIKFKSRRLLEEPRLVGGKKEVVFHLRYLPISSAVSGSTKPKLKVMRIDLTR